MPASDPLPSFRHPPVTEVVVGVGFKPVAELTAPYLGLLWGDAFQTQYPKVQEHPPYEVPVERFDERPRERRISLELAETMPTPRLWFLTQDGQELIQIQRDWLACNWRKVKPQDQYARFPSRAEVFENAYRALESFLEQRSLPRLQPTQCEVTYINHIEPSEVWQSHGAAARVLRLAGAPDGFLPEAENFNLATHYRISSTGEQPVGRLHVEAQGAFRREDDAPIILLTLTARGRPLAEGLDGCMKFLSIGREWIVRSFKEITTPEMHQEWGIED